MLHKRPWFLVLVFLLSLALGMFIYSSYSAKVQQTKPSASTPAISDEAYQQELNGTVKTFLTAYTAAADDSAKSTLVQTLLNQLLHMRVPAQEKDLHLELALSLQQMKEGLQNHSQDATDGLTRFREAVTKTPWMKL